MENILFFSPFAEIIQSSLYQWRAQCWEYDVFPSLGSLVIVETAERIFFGLVYQIETGSTDPVRTPYPYKKTEAELKLEQPHIFQFLKTTFDCLPLGYKEKSNRGFFYQIPPEPPKIHSFIRYPAKELVKEFFSDSRYLHVLFGLSKSVYNLDELLLAMLKKQSEVEPLTEEQLLHFVQTFSLLTGNDYRHLKLFLQRASQHIASDKITF